MIEPADDVLAYSSSIVGDSLGAGSRPKTLFRDEVIHILVGLMQPYASEILDIEIQRCQLLVNLSCDGRADFFKYFPAFLHK